MAYYVPGLGWKKFCYKYGNIIDYVRYFMHFYISIKTMI